MDYEYEKDLATKNMRAGVITGLIIFGIALGKFLIAQFSDVTAASLQGYEDTWVIVDLVLLFLLIWGITKYSRFAASALFLYFLASKIFQFLETGSLLVPAIGSIFLFFFARSVKGTFDYHRLLKNQDPSYQPTKTWMWVVMTPLTLIVMFFITVGLLSKYEIIPVTYVKSKQQITESDRQSLLAMNLIYADTEVDFFYSYGFFSVREGGVLMTDTEVIIYAEQDQQIMYDSMRFDEMQWVKQLNHGNDFEDSLFQISGKEQYRGFQFPLSVEDNIDRVFFQKLENRINPPLPAQAMPMPEFNDSP